MMVQEQIRKAIKDFLAWKDVDCTFQKREVKPFDSINLPVYEFLTAEAVKAALVFVAGMATTLNPAAEQVHPALKS
jgi:hypothetical protein